MQENIEPLWRAYHDGLHRFVRGRVEDAAVADDIVQDVFLKVHTRIGTLDQDTKLKSWIYQIARNAVVDHYRRRRPTEPPSELLAAPATEPSAVARQEVEGCLLPLVQRLPEPYREAVLLSEIQGLTQRQVAQRQGVSLSGAKSRVQRGRALVKDMLERCCRFEFDRRGALIEYEPKDSGCERC